MLNLLIGTDWVANQNAVMSMIAKDIREEKTGRILLVPELISHNVERRLCEVAGDTASRYAEVLPFTRLARRVADQVGNAAEDCLDDGGRIVAMAAAIQGVQSRVKAYAAVSTKPEFLAGLVDAVDEFKRCCISPADLKHASSLTQGSLAQKLEELSLILESYDSICSRGKKDPRDQIQWLLNELQDCTYAQDHIFYIDGFPDFTRQNLAIVEHLMRESNCVTVSLCCDQIDSGKLAFEKAGDTAASLLRLAKKNGIEVNVSYISPRCNPMIDLCERLFQGPIDLNCSCVNLFRTESVFDECTQVASRILKLVHNGARFREIGVVCGDLGTYRNMLNSVFARNHIPAYLSGTDDILEKPIITTVLAAIDTAMGGFDQKDVLRYLKTPFSPLDEQVCDQIENYVIKWGITGNQWLRDWTYHPFELGGKWDEKATALLSQLNQARADALKPLCDMRDGLRKAVNVAQQVEAIYAFFGAINLSDKLSEMADAIEGEDNRTSQILDQLWEILVDALEQLYDTVGQCYWDPDIFSRLFKLLLSQYKVGTIPAVLDSVTVGPVSAMRCQNVKYLFVVGALEGKFPSFGSVTGILTDSERTELRAIGLPLTGGALDGLQIEFSEIYSVFCGTDESVTVSCPSGQPSFVYQRLMKIAGSEEQVNAAQNPCIINCLDAASYFARINRPDLAEQVKVLDHYNEIQCKRNHSIGTISGSGIEKLYGKKLRLSASKVDIQAKCRFSYLLKYGLKLEERKQITIDPAEFGTFVHDVLEKTVGDVMELGGFAVVSAEKTLEIARGHSAYYAKSRFSDFDNERNSHLFKRNTAELEKVVVELWEELQLSQFLPKFMELGFGSGEAMPPIEIDNADMDAQLRGYVDRVDVWESSDRQYFRVVDYKTGKKAFDYCDIANGIGLQMLLYLFALQQNGQHLVGENAIPAGVQYFPARVPFVSVKGVPDEKTLAKVWKDELKRKGLILADEGVIQAMEPLNVPYRLSCGRNKDGDLTGDIASSQEFELLKAYVFDLLRGFVNEIASGVVEPNPYYRDQFDNACKYCPYSSICHKEDVEGYRYYKGISSKEFWETVRKEK